MSHYAVLVIGENINEQLAKFDENLEMSRYVEYTKEELIAKGRKEIEEYKNTQYAEFLKDPEKYKADSNANHNEYIENEFPLKLKWSDEEVYAEEVKWYEPENIGVNGEVYSERNPDSKWDWWTIGGRYRDRLALKENGVGTKGDGLEEYVGSLYCKSEDGYVDSAKKKDIDWSLIHQNKTDYDKAIRHWEMKIEGATPSTKEEEEALKWDWYKNEYYIDKYKNKETYATAMSNFTMWAIVMDGKWYEKGGMGWWAMSDESNDDGLKWELGFYDNFIVNLPEDALLTVVDCHI